MPVSPVVVDAHSHVFNAEDLPIDGFVKELFPVPKLLTGLISTPLDKLTSWLAPGPSNEARRILELLGGAPGGFVAPDTSRWSRGSDLGHSSTGSPAGFSVTAEPEADATSEPTAAPSTTPTGFTVTPPGAVEEDGFGVIPPGAVGGETDLGMLLTDTTPAEQAELEEWYQEWGDEDDAADAGFGLPSWLNPIKVGKAIDRHIEVMKLITRYRHLVVADLAATYPDVALFVPALVDFTAATDDRPATKVREQVQIHSAVAKLFAAGKLPGADHAKVHPFVGYDPLREVQASLLGNWRPSEGGANRYVPFGELVNPDEQDRYRHGMRFEPARARSLRPMTGDWNERVPDLRGVTRSLDVVRHAIEQGGFAGVKIYPPAGFLPLGNHLRFPGDHGERLDVAMRCLYAYCVAREVPILTHAAHSNGFDKDFDELAGPAGWELVLREFPDLRVCFGHFGHLQGVGNDPDRPNEASWPSRFTALIDRYDNVFADVGNSKLPASKDYRNDFTKLLRSYLGGSSPTPAEQKRRRRLLYGSDYWMNMRAAGHRDFLTSFREVIETNFDTATRDAFMGMNALRWLGLVDDTDEPVVGNQNRLRLIDFYGDQHDPPPWLGPR